MTAIVGITDGNTAVIAGDSAGVGGGVTQAAAPRASMLATAAPASTRSSPAEAHDPAESALQSKVIDEASTVPSMLNGIKAAFRPPSP